MTGAPICSVCEEEVVAVICDRGPVLKESADAIRVIVAAHRMIAGHPMPARIQLRRKKGWRCHVAVLLEVANALD